MSSYLKKAHVNKASLSYCSQLIDRCLSFKSFDFAKTIHGHLLKLGFNAHTYLGNRCLDFYSRFGTSDDVLQLFDEIPQKNCISWNICLRGLLKSDNLDAARKVFDEIPEPDVVSWNSMISGYASCGYYDYALEMFSKMQLQGVRPSGFTFTILLSTVSSSCHGKQIHGSMIRSGLSLSNVVLGNSLIDMYGKLGVLYYAFAVFLNMEELDIISWNSLISGCFNSGYGELALDQFYSMRYSGNSPDEYTISIIINACTKLRNLDQGKQVFALSVKVGFLSNSIVLSATIDLFSKCNRLEDSVRLFEQLDRWDYAVINVMISSYGRYGFGEVALELFQLMLREDIRPTEFTLSCVLSSIPIPPVEHGSQFHSMAIKSGFDSNAVVASSLMEMYAKTGSIDSSTEIFVKLDKRDLVSWNTIMMGLTQNGRAAETLDVFEELLEEGLPPDRITLVAVLLACNYGGFVDKGMLVFSAMKEEYGVMPGEEHYACIIDLLCQAGQLGKAIDITSTMPFQPGCSIWESILRASAIYGDVKLTENVAERMMDLQLPSPLPYSLLTQAYAMRGRWEAIVRVKKVMRKNGINKVTGCSWIGIKNRIYTFNAGELQHHGGQKIYLVLRLLTWEMEDEGCVYLECDKLDVEGR